MIEIQPFTYYRTKDRRRGFLVVDVQTEFAIVATVLMLEFGADRSAGQRRPLAEIVDLVESGQLEQFIPSPQ